MKAHSKFDILFSNLILEKHVSLDLGFEKSNQEELNSFPARSLQIYQKKKKQTNKKTLIILIIPDRCNVAKMNEVT